MRHPEMWVYSVSSPIEAQTELRLRSPKSSTSSKKHLEALCFVAVVRKNTKLIIVAAQGHKVYLLRPRVDMRLPLGDMR